MIDILYGDFYGFIADGEMFNGRKAVKAYVVDDDNAGCIEIAYRHDGSESLRAEFDQLFATFRRIAD